MKVWCFDKMELWGVVTTDVHQASFVVCSMYSSYTADEFEVSTGFVVRTLCRGGEAYLPEV